MKYVIDLPDEYNCSCVVVDLPIEIKTDSTTHKRYRLPLEPYKPEPEPKKEEFKVGDEVVNSDGEEAYVLVPDCGNNQFVVLMKDYAFPQRTYKVDWKKTFCHSVTIEDYVKSAYAAMNEAKR